jgi:hypothetical protein
MGDSKVTEDKHDYHLCRVGPLSEMFLLPNGEKMSPSEEEEALRMLELIAAPHEPEVRREETKEKKEEKKDSQQPTTADQSPAAQTLLDGPCPDVSAEGISKTEGSGDKVGDTNAVDVIKKAMNLSQSLYRSPPEQFCIATMSKEAKELLKVFEKARCPVDLCKIIDENESLAIVVTVSE